MPMNEDDVYQFALVARNTRAELSVNTFAFRVASVDNPDDEDTILSSLFNSADGTFTTKIANRFAVVMSDRLTFLHWDVQKVMPTVQQPRRYTLDINGGNDTECSTFNTSVSVTRYGDEGGRRNRGRIAMMGISDEHYDTGVLGPVSKALFEVATQDIVGTYSAPLGIFVLQLGFFVPAHTGIVNGQPVNYARKFTWARRRIVRDTIRVQRSRTVGVGR